MSARVVVWGLLGLAIGCSRDFKPPIAPAPPVLQQIGTACSDGGSCQSGICADGVCCGSKCHLDETCDAPRRAGTCQPRPRGDACDAGAECPHGWCFDGVCCATDCSSLCHACDLPGTAGLCQLAPDDTNPRGDCSGLCSACFAGTCGPAEVGTNPRGDCDGGLVCGIDQTCRVPGGASCDDDSACSTGHCVLGQCLNVLKEQVATGLDINATSDIILGVASTAEGDDAIALEEEKTISEADTRALVEVLVRQAGRGWETFRFYDGSAAANSSDPWDHPLVVPVFLGRSLYLVAYRSASASSAQDCAPNGAGCGVALIPLSLSGAFGVALPIAPNAKEVDSLAAYATPDGALVVGFSGASGFHLYTRASSSNHLWTHGDFNRPSDYQIQNLALVHGHGEPSLVYGADLASGSGMAVLAPDGGILSTIDGSKGFPCANATPALYGPRGYSDGPIRLTVDCPRASWLATLDFDGGAAASSFTSMGDNVNPAVGFTLGTLADGLKPEVVFGKVNTTASGSLSTFVTIATPDAGALDELADNDFSSDIYWLSSIDVGATGSNITIAYTGLGPGQIGVIRLSP